MKKHGNNMTWVLLAVLSFLVGVLLISAYASHLRHEEQEKIEAKSAEAEAEVERQAKLEAELAEEAKRRQTGDSAKEEGELDADSVPGVDVDQALGSDLGHKDLSSYVQNLDGLVNETSASKVSGYDEEEVYETEDGSLVITKTGEDSHKVELTGESSYSLYHIFVGMLQVDANDYLQEKGYSQSNRNGLTCYKIDDYKVLYLKFDGKKVLSISLEVEN